MEKKIIIAKRFRNNTLRVYQYLLKEFSTKNAHRFLNRLEKRIEFVAKSPETGKASFKKKTYAVFCLHRITRYFIRYRKNTIEYFASLICGETPRKGLIDLKNVKTRRSGIR